MSNHKITLTLDPQSINKATRQLRAYKKELRVKITMLMQRVVTEGAELAKAKVAQMDAIMYGDLIASIAGVYDPAAHLGIIYAGAPHAVYVEYGTGVVGAGSPHPEPIPGWKYDSNNHGEDGWWYWSNADDNWHWTRGLPSRPFMWQTSRELPAIMAAAAKAVFG
jgi:hypothetical protein